MNHGPHALGKSYTRQKNNPLVRVSAKPGRASSAKGLRIRKPFAVHDNAHDSPSRRKERLIKRPMSEDAEIATAVNPHRRKRWGNFFVYNPINV